MGRSVDFLRRLSVAVAGLALALVFSTTVPRQADAGIILGASDSVGLAPAFAGTGLFGTYYNTTNGTVANNSTLPVLVNPNNPSVVSFTSSFTPIATFTTTNICYPDCASGVFSDPNGGFVPLPNHPLSFSNGHVSNVNFFPNVMIPTDWTYSGLDINGYLAIKNPGTYTFSLGSDDRSSLSIAGQNILTIPGCCRTISTDVTFNAAGLYAISAQILEFGGGSYLDVYAQDSNKACLLGCSDGNGGLTETGLYYSTSQLEGAPAPAIGGGGVGLFFLVILAGGNALRQYRQRTNV